MQRFGIIFDQNLVKLAGFQYGQLKFRETIEGRVNPAIPFTIIFPPHIDFIGESFIQGFFGSFLESGAADIELLQKNMSISSGVPDLKEQVVQSLS